jgi:hypothetical protein
VTIAGSSESRHGQPSRDCLSDAGHWHSINDHFTELEVTELIAGLVRGLQPSTCIETGSYHGQTSEAIGQALLSSGHGELITLDTDSECCRITRERCDGLPVIVLDTDARRWQPQTLWDFAFVDSGEPADRIADLDQLRLMAAPQALLCVHDTGTQFSLRLQLRNWAELHSWPLLLLPTPRGLGLLRPPGGGAIIV